MDYYKESKFMHFIFSVLSSVIYTGIALFLIYIIYDILPVAMKQSHFIKFLAYLLAFLIILVLFFHRWRVVWTDLRISSNLLSLRINEKEEFINLVKCRIDTCSITKDTLTKKLDILKYFSPFSFVPFFLGFFIENKSFMNEVVPILDLKIHIREMIIGIGIMIFLVHISSLYNTFFNYQRANMAIEAYQRALNNYLQEQEKHQ